MTDIAMTTLFGGLPACFYQQMNYLTDGLCDKQLDCLFATYNLYHALNHLNLFGQSYQGLISHQLHRIKVF